MNIVFDTNIYFAAAKEGFSFYLLQIVLNPKNGYSLFISNAILEELQEKLEFAIKQKYINSEKADYLVETIKVIRKVEPEIRIVAVKDDPDDNKILECAVAAEADLIVTMDKHLLKLKVYGGIAIVHPKTFSFMFPKD